MKDAQGKCVLKVNYNLVFRRTIRSRFYKYMEGETKREKLSGYTA